MISDRVLKKISKADIVSGHTIEYKESTLKDGDNNILVDYSIKAGSNDLDISFLENVGKLYIEFIEGTNDIDIKFPNRVEKLQVMKSFGCNYINIDGLENVRELEEDVFKGSTFNCKVRLHGNFSKGFNMCYFGDDIILSDCYDIVVGSGNKHSRFFNSRGFALDSIFEDGVYLNMAGDIVLEPTSFNNANRGTVKKRLNININYKTNGEKRARFIGLDGLISRTEGEVLLDFRSVVDIVISAGTVYYDGDTNSIGEYIHKKRGKLKAKLHNKIERGIFKNQSLRLFDIELSSDKGKENILYLGKKGIEKYNMFIGEMAFHSSNGIRGISLEDSVIVSDRSFEAMEDLEKAKICMCHIVGMSDKDMVRGYDDYIESLKGYGAYNSSNCAVRFLFRDCKKLKILMVELSKHDLVKILGEDKFKMYVSYSGHDDTRKAINNDICDIVKRKIFRLKHVMGCDSLESIAVVSSELDIKIGEIKGLAIEQIVSQKGLTSLLNGRD